MRDSPRAGVPPLPGGGSATLIAPRRRRGACPGRSRAGPDAALRRADPAGSRYRLPARAWPGWPTAQGSDGTWKGGNEGCGVDGICVMAFLASGEGPELRPLRPDDPPRALRSIIQATGGKDRLPPQQHVPPRIRHAGVRPRRMVRWTNRFLWEGEQTRALPSARRSILAIRCTVRFAKEKPSGAAGGIRRMPATRIRRSRARCSWACSPRATPASTSPTRPSTPRWSTCGGSTAKGTVRWRTPAGSARWAGR